MDETRLLVAQLGGSIAADAEVGVLVDGAGDQGRDLGHLLRVAAEDVREGGSESRGRLDRDVVVLANAVTRGLSVLAMNVRLILSYRTCR